MPLDDTDDPPIRRHTRRRPNYKPYLIGGGALALTALLAVCGAGWLVYRSLAATPLDGLAHLGDEFNADPHGAASRHIGQRHSFVGTVASKDEAAGTVVATTLDRRAARLALKPWQMAQVHVSQNYTFTGRLARFEPKGASNPPGRDVPEAFFDYVSIR